MSSSAEAVAEGGLGGPFFLGLLQGLTEFLPVSSSGHLVLFQQFPQFFYIGDDHLLFDVILHLGTLVPVLWLYRASLWQVMRDPFVGEAPFFERNGVRLVLLLVLATLPTAAIGLLFEAQLDALFANPTALVFTFAMTGTFLWVTRGRPSGPIDLSRLTWRHAAIIGVAQAVAVAPGISRSGTTIAASLLLGLEREFAARFSFLLSVPTIAGAGVLKLARFEGDGIYADQVIVGTLTAMVVGYLSLIFLVEVVKRGNFAYFAWYCWALALLSGIIAVGRWVTGF